MDITKEEAREVLEREIVLNKMPIYDKVVYQKTSKNSITSYTFRGLLKYIYSL